ncbi:hypothetical protein DTL42_15545 [Bremerella cremea]|uniref:Uncharacterized protein n=1 Tax=Bremerella cremea TaxID=1031537 RepID=A0A368KPH1_9BACT|nr:hypothetical protein [Bremerella cremea]RCS46380.1 hypothetical protein DTL42_15545 [Bremerella cremea]
MRPQIIMIVLATMVACVVGPVRSQEPVALPPIPSAEVPPAEKMDQIVFGEPNCCGHCATQCECQKRTRIVCEMKKVKKVSFSCDSEQVCGLLPSSMLPDTLFGISLFGHKKTGCGETGCTDCAQGCCDKAPRATHCRTRRVLVRKTTTVEVPAYKCVVEYCCQGCGAAIDAAPQAATKQAAVSDAEVQRMAALPRDRSGYGE